jgi:hypothetical protein
LEQADDVTVGFDLDMPRRAGVTGSANGARNHGLGG